MTFYAALQHECQAVLCAAARSRPAGAKTWLERSGPTWAWSAMAQVARAWTGQQPGELTKAGRRWAQRRPWSVETPKPCHLAGSGWGEPGARTTRADRAEIRARYAGT